MDPDLKGGGGSQNVCIAAKLLQFIKKSRLSCLYAMRI